MRHRELSENRGQRGQKSQSMLVAQLLLSPASCLPDLPAAMRVFQSDVHPYP